MFWFTAQVESSDKLFEEEVDVCLDCVTATRAKFKAGTQPLTRPECPRRSIAFMDWGRTSHLPPLSPMEQLALARNLMFGRIIQLRAIVGTGNLAQQALKGFTAVFPLDTIVGAEGVLREDLHKHVCLNFIGDKKLWKNLLSQRNATLDRTLRLDWDKLEVWLNVLRETGHQDFQDVPFPSTDEEVEEQRAKLARQRELIIENAVVDDDPRTRNLLQWSDVAQVFSQPVFVFARRGSIFVWNNIAQVSYLKYGTYARPMFTELYACVLRPGNSKRPGLRGPTGGREHVVGRGRLHPHPLHGQPVQRQATTDSRNRTNRANVQTRG